MKRIQTILIDDEESALRTLAGMLTTFCPQVHIIAEASNIRDGLSAIREHQPDLIFLDIEISPEGNGFDLLSLLPEPNFGVIFSTAYTEYAIQAINHVQPWGYLVKPFRVSDLVKTVNIAYNQLFSNIDTERESIKEHQEQGIIIPDRRKGNLVVHIKDILYCKADHHTTDIYFIKDNELKKITSSKSLKTLSEQLPTHLFCRTHHSYVVNMKHIIRYQRTGRNGLIYLPHNCQAKISVMKMDRFEQHFKRMLNG